MPYVMIPVPEEHVQEAMEAVLRISARAKLREWDEAGIEQLFGKVDEMARALMSLASRAALAGKDLTQQQAADLLQISQREVVGVLRDINEEARSLEHPNLMMIQEIIQELPNGRTRTTMGVSMAREVAQLVREIERADLEAGPNPLAKLEE